jgi:hypothetical protein
LQSLDTLLHELVVDRAATHMSMPPSSGTLGFMALPFDLATLGEKLLSPPLP